MATPHGERCFCSMCVQGREAARRQKRYRDKDVDTFVKRREQEQSLIEARNEQERKNIKDRLMEERHMRPEIGKWYMSTFGNEKFTVVAVEDEEVVEIQHEDGDVEEMDIEDWDEACVAGVIVQAAPPIGDGADGDDAEGS